MDNESDLSDDAPEEFSLKVAVEETQEQERNKNKEITLMKTKQKNIRRLNHERNKEQKNRKKLKLQELESKKLSEELINDIIKEKSSKIKTKKKSLKQKNPKKKVNSTSVKIDNSNLPVVVCSLEMQEKKASSLSERALNFRKKCLFRKNIQRISGHELRMMNEKIVKGKKDVHVT